MHFQVSNFSFFGQQQKLHDSENFLNYGIDFVYMHGYVCRVKNYYWPLAVFRPKLPNGQPLSKVVGRLGQPSVKIVKAS